MKKFTTLISFIFIFLNSHSQDTVYFNSDWKVCDQQHADYYRTIALQSGIYEIKDFYISGILQMTGYSSVKDSLFRQGEFSYYNAKGTLTEVIKYTDNVRNGKTTQYFDNGKPKRITHFVNDKFNGETSYFNSNGILIGKGQAKDNYWFGRWEKYNDDGSFLTYLYYDDNFIFPEIGLKTSTPDNIWIYFDKVVSDTTIRYLCRPVNSKSDALAKYTQSPDVYIILPKNESQKFNPEQTGRLAYKFSIKDTALKIYNTELVRHIPVENELYSYYYIDITSGIKKIEIIIIVKEDRFDFYEKIINEFVSNLHL